MSKIANFLARFKSHEMLEILRDGELTLSDKEIRLTELYNELKGLHERQKAEEPRQEDARYKTHSTPVNMQLGNKSIDELKAMAEELRKTIKSGGNE